jgi:hypothetical protein
MLGGCLIAALVMPVPHGPRWASYAQGDIQALLSAQSAWSAAVNEMGFATLECLTRADGCLPGQVGATLLDPTFVTKTERHMHLFTFYPGSPIEAARARELKVPPSTIQSFA